MVKVIQTQNLVKLGGRTPSNTVYSRLSQDARIVNVARGAYALAEAVGLARAQLNSRAPPRFDGTPDDGDTESVRGDGGAAPGHESGDETRVNLLSDESLERSPAENRRVSTRWRREARPASNPSRDAPDTARLCPTSTLADSSPFSVERGGGALRGGAFDDDGDVELSAELSAGVLMGLRSGKRHVSACR
jgi:hypothetical protein